MTLNNYNQLLEELLKLFPEESNTITSTLIMDDDIKMQSVDLFTELLQNDDLFQLFSKRKIKVFSSKTESTKSLSSSLFGTGLTLKNIFNNQPADIKTTLWTYLQLIYLTKLLENKNDNKERINLLEKEIRSASVKKVTNENTSKDTSQEATSKESTTKGSGSGE